MGEYEFGSRKHSTKNKTENTRKEQSKSNMDLSEVIPDEMNVKIVSSYGHNFESKKGSASVNMFSESKVFANESLSANQYTNNVTNTRDLADMDKPSMKRS